MQLVKGKPASYVMLAKVRRGRVAFRVPNAQHMRGRGTERLAALAR